MLLTLSHVGVTQRRNGGSMCGYTNNMWRATPNGTLKTESRPTRTSQNHETEARQQGPKQPATAGSAPCTPEWCNHTAPNSPKCNAASSMRLHPDTRGKSNQGTAPAATTEAPGKPRRLKGNMTPSHRQPRCHISNTTEKTL